MAAIGFNSYACFAFGNTVLSISRFEWSEPAQIFIMTQSLDASVSSLLIHRLVRKSFYHCRCMVLTSAALY